MNYSDLIKNNISKTYVMLLNLDVEDDIYSNIKIGLEDKIDFYIKKNNLNNYKKIYLCKNSKLDLLDYNNVDARIEYGAVIRQNVIIEKGAIIMMNATINVGAKIGTNTLIDMGSVIGSGAIIGNNCHIGANSVISGMIEPDNKNVNIGNNVFIGANCFIKSGIKIHDNAVIGAGAVVLNDVYPNDIVAGVPAKKINSNYKYIKNLDIYEKN